ncbi:DUF3168 domain-containing protein [Aquamicrobium soli]|jgi:hypothetical protein|uniref:DUF3168 domain-containing protein n=1 Tax=Aquamicrobium soli TaxID=1811518 RepID=A0ABV7KH85_9HYPH
MTAPAAEFQKALFEVLAGDDALTGLLGGAKIFDQAPADARFPYATFGRTSFYDWSTSTEGGVEQLFTLHVWSKAKGKKEILGIMERVKLRLDDADLALEMHRLVSLRFDYGEARYDEDVAVHHGLLRFRAVIETAA